MEERILKDVSRKNGKIVSFNCPVCRNDNPQRDIKIVTQRDIPMQTQTSLMDEL
jgi:hypothetical protein